MPQLLHITHQDQWQQAQINGAYRADSLDSEGFIHCSTPDQVLWVANTFYRDQCGLVLLRIDPDRLQSELRYDTIPDGRQFPHVYGEINLDAIVDVIDFPPESDGTFALSSTLKV